MAFRFSSFAFALAALVAAASAQAARAPCRVGLHLERAGVLNYPGTIDGYDADKGAYHVRYDNGGLPEWIAASGMSRSCIATAAPQTGLGAFIGDWEMFVSPTAQYEMRGGDRWLDVGPGAVAPPLSIRPDGTYVWAVGRGKVISGRWRRMSRAEMKYGFKDKVGILLMHGYDGGDWQVTSSGVRASDKRDQLGVERMDLGLSYLATRMH